MNSKHNCLERALSSASVPDQNNPENSLFMQIYAFENSHMETVWQH